MTHPLVSVIIPAYNIQDYIGRALDSVFSQSIQDYEIIVIDDGSTDSTASVIKSYSDPRLHYIYQANQGLSGARNTAIKAANGHWIALLDGDDLWMPDRLRLQLENFNSHPNLVWGCCNHEIYNMTTSQTRLMQPVSYCQNLTGQRGWFDSFFKANLSRIWWPPSTMMIQRNIFDTVGLFRKDLRFAEDIEMWWRIAYQHRQFGFIPQPLVRYYESRPDSLMAATAQDQKVIVMSSFFDEHLQLSRQYDCFEGIRGFIDRNIRHFISQYYLADNLYQVRRLLKHYRQVLPLPYRWAMAVLIHFGQPRSPRSKFLLQKLENISKAKGYEIAY